MAIAVLIILLAVFVLYAWQTQRLMEDLRRENASLRDRWNLSKALPPEGVNVQKVHEDREKAKQDRIANKVPGIGPLQKRRMEAQSAERLQ